MKENLKDSIQDRAEFLSALKRSPGEETLWNCVLAFREYEFRTMSGLPFSYQMKRGRDGSFTRELWIDRRESSKSLAWSSVMLAYRGIQEIGELVERPKALGDIRGVSYVYGIFYRFGLIEVPEKVKEKMSERPCSQQKESCFTGMHPAHIIKSDMGTNTEAGKCGEEKNH